MLDDFDMTLTFIWLTVMVLILIFNKAWFCGLYKILLQVEFCNLYF